MNNVKRAPVGPNGSWMYACMLCSEKTSDENFMDQHQREKHPERPDTPNGLRIAAGLDALPDTVFGMTREEFEGFLGNPVLEDWQWNLMVRLKDVP